jgi:hypothetical protein
MATNDQNLNFRLLNSEMRFKVPGFSDILNDLNGQITKIKIYPGSGIFLNVLWFYKSRFRN